MAQKSYCRQRTTFGMTGRSRATGWSPRSSSSARASGESVMRRLPTRTNASLCQGAWLGASVVGWWPGPGVACPKSRLLGCDPAALAAESFPYCPPGSLTWACARRASARRRVKTASLTCRLRERRASLWVLPSASFLS